MLFDGGSIARCGTIWANLHSRGVTTGKTNKTEVLPKFEGYLIYWWGYSRIFTDYLLSSFFACPRKFWGYSAVHNQKSINLHDVRKTKKYWALKKGSLKNRNLFDVKVEKDLKGSLDSIPSPSFSVKFKLWTGKESLFTSLRNVLPYYLK